MFADTHLMDVTRLMTLGHPSSYLFLVLPYLYLFTRTPGACLFRPPSDLSRSNKGLTPAGNPRGDMQLLLGILAGTYVLWQSNVADMVYVSAGLLQSALAHHPL